MEAFTTTAPATYTLTLTGITEQERTMLLTLFGADHRIPNGLYGDGLFSYLVPMSEKGIALMALMGKVAKVLRATLSVS